MPNRQARVPEQREEAGENRVAGLLRVRFSEHQQVDVRLREQFTATVTTDCEQLQR